MRNLIASLTLAALPVVASAQGAAAKATPAPSGGQVTIGIQQVDNNTNSSAFTEYRDLRDGRTPIAFTYGATSASGLFFDFAGADVTRRDQSLGLSLGQPGVWRLKATWDELPHDMSNKAKTPFTSTKPGVLDVSQTMAITFKKLATSAADAPGVVASDAIAAAYIQANARPVTLGTTSKDGAFQLQYSGIKSVNLSFGYTRREKAGNRIGYGPIGDRPPRTLNIQFAEPVDQSSGDLTMAAEIVKPRYQLRAEYLLSKFENEIDVLTWRNVWTSAPAGATYDSWDRAVAVYGRRPLAPDNSYQSMMFSGGLALPFASRLTASIALGTMEQDGKLLPYAYQNDLLVDKTLPRSTTQGKHETTSFSAEYSISPLPQMNVRAFARHYGLANKTPKANWQYVTQDASNLNGTVIHHNKRINQPFAWDRQNFGLETTVRMPILKGSVVLGFEREDVGREYLEAKETSENIVRLAWNGRPAKWISVRARLLYGSLDAGVYDWNTSTRSYWYTAAEVPSSDVNNPRFAFENHPDMRSFTMTDRKRDQADLTITVTPTSKFSVATRLKTRTDDFATDVRPVQPLINLSVPDREARTPGIQLGLLKRAQQQLSFDVTYAPSERVGLNGSYGYDIGTSNMRSMEFNENNRTNPSTVNTAAFGPWTRSSNNWTADFDDRNAFMNFGGTFELVPNKVTMVANYSNATADMDITYAGFGAVDYLGVPFAANHEFSFNSPPPVEQRTQVIDLSLQTPLFGRMKAQVGLRNEKFTLDDWQQSAGTPMFESVGSELLLRDTSRSHQWGNRLLNLGSYLAPSYTGTSVYVGITYGFGGTK